MDNPFGKKTEIVKANSEKLDVAKKEPEKKEIKKEEPEVKISEPKAQNAGSQASKKRKILERYGNKESNIPVNSPYWKMKWNS